MALSSKLKTVIGGLIPPTSSVENPPIETNLLPLVHHHPRASLKAFGNRARITPEFSKNACLTADSIQIVEAV